jgi:ketosteroid isomerase-like protein
MEAWELAAREAIRELAARYAHCADGGRFDELVALFADDGVLAIADRPPLAGRNAIRTFLADTAAALASGSAPKRLRHHVASHTITVDDRTTAHGAAYFLVVTADGPDHWGRYRDRYVARNGGWVFAERRVRVDGRRT